MLTFVGVVYSGACAYAGWYLRGKYQSAAALKAAFKAWLARWIH